MRVLAHGLMGGHRAHASDHDGRKTLGNGHLLVAVVPVNYCVGSSSGKKFSLPKSLVSR